MLFFAVRDGAGLGTLRPMLHGLVAQFADSLHQEVLHFVGRAPRGVALSRSRQAKDGFKLLEEFGPNLELGDKLLETML
jgi:hypothetical protein